MFFKPFVNSKKGTLGNDPKLRAVIQDASKNIPRYLFRVWHSKSGGDSSLNTIDSVTPHAFAPYYKTGHDSIYEMNTEWFIENLIGHFHAQQVPPEFSSWTESPVFAIRLAFSMAEHKKRQNVHIAIVDTEKLKNTVLSVLSTEPIFRSHAPEHADFVSTIHFEHIVHGVIRGEAYKAVALTTLNDCGLSNYFSGFKSLDSKSRYIGRHVVFKLPEPAIPLSKTEAKSLLEVAGLYGEAFRVPFFVALICCKLRPESLRKSDLSEVDMIIRLLGGQKAIPDWSTSRGVVCNNIYNSRYDDGHQMQIIMRALNDFCLGRGARHRVLDDMDLLAGGLSALNVD